MSDAPEDFVTGQKWIKCIICAESFSDQSHLIEHAKSHGETSKHIACDICKKIFAHKSSLSRHKHSHTDNKKYFKCNVCNKAYSRLDNLKDHEQKHRDESLPEHLEAQCISDQLHKKNKDMKCDNHEKLFEKHAHVDQQSDFHSLDASFVFVDAQQFLIESCFEEHENLDQIQCEIVLEEKDGVICKTEPTQAHVVSWGASTLQENANGNSLIGQKQFENISTKSDSGQVHLDENTKSHKGTSSITCDICKQTFAFRSSLSRHKQSHAVNKKYFMCKFCDKAFSRLDNLKDHEVKHTNESFPQTLKAQCISDQLHDKDIKGDTHEKYGNVDQQNNLHSTDASFVFVNGQQFLIESCFEVHKNLEETNPIKCEKYSDEKDGKICEKRHAQERIVNSKFSTSQKNDNENSLIGQKQFENISVKAPSEHGHLVENTKSHEGKSSITCDVCKKTFAHSSSLSRHKHSHTNKKKYFKCKVCNKAFSLLDNLKDHEEKHTNESYPQTLKARCISDQLHDKDIKVNNHEKHGNVDQQNNLHSTDASFVFINSQQFLIESFFEVHKNLEETDSIKCEKYSEEKDSKICEKRHAQECIVNSKFSTSQESADENSLICQKQFKNMNVEASSEHGHLGENTKYHEGKSSITCGVCKKTFAHSSSLSRHKHLHTNKKKYLNCKFCNKSFSRLDNLNDHEGKHTYESLPQNLKAQCFSDQLHDKKKDIKCDDHQESFAKHDVNQQNNLLSADYSCVNGGKSLIKNCFEEHKNLDETDLRKYSEEKDSKVWEKRQGQDICVENNISQEKNGNGNLLIDQMQFEKLSAKSYSEQGCLGENTKSDKGTSPFSCNICKKVFVHQSSLSRHKQSHKALYVRDGNNKRIRCEVCGNCFANSSSLQKHASLFHGPGKKHECDICQKVFPLQRKLTIHKKIHISEESVECDVCFKTFSRKVHLQLHMRQHASEKLFPCEICGKRFITLGRLRKHGRSHTGERPFECELCGKAFFHSWNMKMHQRLHRGDAFKCDVCGKGFMYNTALKSHKRSHTKSKPFECELCGKTFSTGEARKVHGKRHAEEKPFQCDICQKCFIFRSLLNIHLRSHTGEKPFECDLCGKCYSSRYCLNKHTKIHKKKKNSCPK